MNPLPNNVTVVDHPLIQSRLTHLRDQRTGLVEFRRNLQEIAQLMTFEATRDLELEEISVATPMTETKGVRPARPIVLVPILRAGIGMLDGILKVLPEAQIGHIGMARNEQTHRAESYYRNFPADLADAEVLLVDPMLATGGSAAEAARQLQEAGAARLRFLCLVACPDGIMQFTKLNPDVHLFTAAVDPELDQNAYIVPGLGDAGDRYFGT